MNFLVEEHRRSQEYNRTYFKTLASMYGSRSSEFEEPLSPHAYVSPTEEEEEEEDEE